MPRYIDTEKINYQYLPIPTIGDQFITKSAIDNMPEEDVAEVKHGEWGRQVLVYDRFGDKRIGYICPVCNEFVPNKGNYCLNCGAKMDGGDSE